jgi:alanine racemase
MALRLTVQRGAWDAHVRSVAAAVNGLVPVVKGNGYGFGRATLHAVAGELSEFVCVGTMFELDDDTGGVTQVVLTPARVAPQRGDVVATIGSEHDAAALTGWNGRVLIKLQSSMRRFGSVLADLPRVFGAAKAAGLDVIGYSLHLPLAGTDTDRRNEVEAWLAVLDGRPLWLSHLQPDSFAAVQGAHPGRQLRLRLGTQLWHGDKSFLQLHADVLAVHAVRAGESAGYQLGRVPGDGRLVIIGAGSAHGVAPLPGGLSPFHFARHRLTLLEPPHMHTSMVFVPDGAPCPSIEDCVDVQRPLIDTNVDEIEWVL